MPDDNESSSTDTLSGSGSVFSDRDWRNLVRDIHNRQIVPVVGPELVTILDSETGKEIPLYRYLAPRLASRLGLEDSDTFQTVNAAVCAHLVRGGRRRNVYDELRELMDENKSPPGAALVALARITDFDFLVTSTFDHQLATALSNVRPNFNRETQTFRFHPNKPKDIPEPLDGDCLFHILGDFNTYPDFAVWEEDYMEFVCGLIESRDFMERFFRLVKNRYLLLLGAPASDWIVRFLLRVARQERLSDRGESATGEYLADLLSSLEPPLVFYLDKLIHATRVIDGPPSLFVQELARRWEEKHGQPSSDQDFLSRLPETMPKDSVFISYAREDLEAALKVARGLHAAGVPVWMDKGRLQAGENYQTSLEAAVRVHCSFFLSIISDATESDLERNRYVHRERDWAASRHMDGFIFYVPVSIRAPGSPPPRVEPSCFSHIHYHCLPGGETTAAFVRNTRQLVESYRISGRPRG